MTSIYIPNWVFECQQIAKPLVTHHITKGYGSGGTWGATVWHAYQSLYVNQDFDESIYIAPTYAQIETPVVITMFETLSRYFKLEQGKHYSMRWGRLPTLTFLNTNHKIRFISANNPERLIGINASHATGTEPGLWKSEVFERLTSRVRLKGASNQKLFEGTPEGMTAWERLANFEGKWRKDHHRIILPTEYNRHNLGEGWIEALIESLQHDEAKLLAYTEGVFTNFIKGDAFWNWRSKYIDPHAIQTHLAPICVCWDFNLAPLSWVVFQPTTQDISGFRRKIFPIVSEASGNSKGLTEAIADFIYKFPPEIYQETEINIYGDCNGNNKNYRAEGSDYDEILKALRRRYSNVNFRVKPSNPRVKARLERVNNLFIYDRIKVNPQCVRTIRAFEKTGLKQGTYDIEKPSKEDWTHFGEAVSYGLYDITVHEDLEKPSERIKIISGKN